jgi:hypothetical protein
MRTVSGREAIILPIAGRFQQRDRARGEALAQGETDQPVIDSFKHRDDPILPRAHNPVLQPWSAARDVHFVTCARRPGNGPDRRRIAGGP